MSLQDHTLTFNEANVSTGEVRFVHGVCVHHLSYQLHRVVEELRGSDVGPGFRAGLFEQGQEVIGSDRTV